MQNALVTGAAGFVGAHIVRELVGRGVEVRGLAQASEPLDNLQGLELEVVRGDVRDPDRMREVVRGIDTVFHAAAIYEAYSKDPGRMYDVNLQGTFHVLEAARRAGVARIVYTASIAALGRPAPGTIADASTDYEAWDVDFAYSRSKYFSKRIAQNFAAWGMDVRIVCPGIVIGPGDRTPTPSGRLLMSIASGRAPGWVEGGATYVDVRDAALGHVRAAEREEPGGAWIVTGHNLSNHAFIDVVCRVCGMRPRSLKVPVPLARAWVRTLERLATRKGTIPDIASPFFEYGLRDCFYDNATAVRDLGLRFRPIDDTIRDALAWFREQKML